MARFSLTRECYLTPALRTVKPMVPEGTDLAIYTSEVNGVPYAIAFQGKAQKPFGNYRFSTVERRADWIERIAAARRGELERKRAAAETKKNFKHSFQVGDILVSTWGYDQTNVDFYQVTARTDKTVKVRKIASRDASRPDSAWMTGDVVAAPDVFTGEEMLCRPSGTDSVRVRSFASAYKWDGKPVHFTSYA